MTHITCTVQARAQDIGAHRRLTSLTLAKHTSLLEVLELPQLMETTVRNQHYEEALELQVTQPTLSYSEDRPAGVRVPPGEEDPGRGGAGGHRAGGGTESPSDAAAAAGTAAGACAAAAVPQGGTGLD